MKIRLIEEQDLQALAEVYTEVYSRLAIGENWTVESSYKLMEFLLKRQPDLAFLAEIDGRIVGAHFKGIKPWWDGNHLDIGEIFVHPEFHKKGIGTELSKVLYKKALEKYNISHVDAITFKKSEFPLRWYKAIGFEESKDLTLISGKTEVLLKKLEKK